MSGIFLWGGVFCILGLPPFGFNGILFQQLGGILLGIGVLLLILGR